MSAWTRLRDRALSWLAAALGLSGAATVAGCEDGALAPPSAWDKATKASCWFQNAAHRAMNVLSPLMPDDVFRARVAEMKARGVNTAHVILVNRGDGEYAGYSPWGVGAAPAAAECDKATAELMAGRIRALRREGWAVVVWIEADDSAAWARALAANAGECLRHIAAAGLLADASIVVAGLEMDEYWGAAEAAAVVSSVRKVWGGKVGVHHLSHRATFAGLGDILFYQVSEGRSAAQIAQDVAAAKGAGKPVCLFELARNPDRALCEAALKAGAFAVGNW